MRLFRRSPPSIPDVDCSNAFSFYTNDTHVLSCDDEVVLSLGVRPLPNSTAHLPVERVYMSFFSAKRLLTALEISVERHEAIFGLLRDQRPSEAMLSPDVVARALYANFARVSGSPEELTLELGVNPGPVPPTADVRVAIHSQAALSFATAKSLLRQLTQVVDEYEGRYGEVQLDVAERVR